MLRALFSTDLLGSWVSTAIAILLAVGTYRFTARRLQPQLAELRQSTSRHPIITLLLILYCLIGGIMLGFMLVSSVNKALGAISMFALPFLAGCCGGWWQAQSDTPRPGVRPTVEQGMLVGLLVTVVPAALAVIVIAWFAWSSPTGEPPFTWNVLGVLGAFFGAGAYLALGMVLGALGALLGVTVHHWRHRGGPIAPAGVS